MLTKIEMFPNEILCIGKYLVGTKYLPEYKQGISHAVDSYCKGKPMKFNRMFGQSIVYTKHYYIVGTTLLYETINDYPINDKDDYYKIRTKDNSVQFDIGFYRKQWEVTVTTGHTNFRYSVKTGAKTTNEILKRDLNLPLDLIKQIRDYYKGTIVI